MELRLRLTVVPPAAAHVDVVLDAEPGTTLADARHLLTAISGLPDDSPFYVEGALLPGSRLLGRPPLVEGAVLTGGVLAGQEAHREASLRPPRRHGFLELHVTGGPDAGHVHRLAPGRWLIGRSPSARVTVGDPDVSRIHAHLDVGPSGVTVSDADSTNGTLLDGVRVGRQPCAVEPGATLVLGSSTLALRLPDVRHAATTNDGEGRIHVNRAPRHHAAPAVRELSLPEAPEEPERPNIPVLGMVVPLLVSIPMALLWSPLALLLGLTAPVMMLGNVASDVRSRRRRHRRALVRHRDDMAELDGVVAAELRAETLWRRQQAPDAAALLTIASTPTTRLWERGTADDDALLLRIGTGRVAATSVRLRAAPGAGPPPRRAVAGVPLTVCLRRAGVVGMSGRRTSRLGMARYLVGQVATLHSPRDVRIAVLTDSDSAGDDWGWVRWLPHAAPDERWCPGVASPADDLRHAVGVLRDVVRRRKVRRAGGGDDAPSHPAVVVLLDGAQRLRPVAGVAELLRDGPAHGVYLVCLDDAPGHLPAECAVTLELGGETGSRVTVSGPDEMISSPWEEPPPVADLVSAAWAEQLARALAPLRDATPSELSDVVPATARLLDLLPAHLDLPAVDAGHLARRWASVPRSTRAVLGVTAQGVYAPDLCEDGPHVLVGGTTGSGKSELLQTLIASLAAANRPEELSFVLVDYKGGAAFADCARLPHTVGLVTDLDAHLTTRALTSLSAEIRRRERLLAAAGAGDLAQYQQMLDAGQAGTPVSRLVVVIDEFRVLAEEHPDFVTGLVRLAAVGRSLGVHLVLATQRPGGVVGPDIKANVNLRIALRVRDSADSLDVVDAPDAASIDSRTPGRAMSRSGSGPLVTFQTARVGGRPVGAGSPRLAVRRLSHGGRDAAKAAVLSQGPEPGPSDLGILVDCIAEAANRVGAIRQPSPWLPPLPDVVRLEGTARSRDTAGSTALTLGIVDEPEAMAQRPWSHDPATDGPLLVVGTGRTGRTTTLRTFAAAAAAVSPERLHLYALDGGGGGLAGLDRLPHTGAVVPRGQPERMLRLVRRLRAEVEGRRAAATASPGRQHPAVLVLVDAWDVVQRELEEVEHGVGVEDLLRVVREGPSVGVASVVTGDRSLLTGRLASAVSERLVLRTADPTDAVLAGVSVKDLPERMPPGRGLLVGPSGVREVQVALAGGFPGTEADDVPPASRPFRVDPLPDRLPVAELHALVAREPSRTATWVPVGVGGDDVRPVGLDLREHPVVLVAGPPGSGRSTVLRAIADSLGRSSLTPLLVRPGTATEDAAALAAVLRGEIGGGHVVVLVDDVTAVDGTALEPVLVEATSGTASPVVGLVVAGDPTELGSRFRGVAALARQARAGVLLSPTGYADGDLLGVSVPRSAVLRPGLGYLVRRGRAVPVRVATVDP